MGVRNKVKSFFQANPTQQSDGLFVSIFNEYSDKNLHNMSKTDYLAFYKGRCFVAVSTIANEIAGLDRQVVDAKGKPINDPTLDLITYDLLVNVVSYMKLNGACYIWKNMVGKKVTELVILRPDTITPVFDTTGTTLVSYKYQIGNGTKIIPAEEIICIANFNPMLPYPLNYVGFSDVQAIATAIDADYQASKRNRKYFYNNASVSGVLETDKDISQENSDKITKKREQKYRGVDNAHKVGVLSGGLKYKPINPSQKEMDFVESRKFNRDEILGFFKVPKSIIGLGEGDNALNVRSFDGIFARRTIKPLSVRIAEALNDQLFTSGTFEFVNIIPADLTETRLDYQVNGITLNEFRASRGLPALADGDKLSSAYAFGGETMEVAPIDETEKTHDPIHKHVCDYIHKAVEHAVATVTEGTDERKEKRRSEKIARVDNKRKKEYNEKLQLIFRRQEKEVIAGYKKRAHGKSLDKANYPLLNLQKWKMVYEQLLGPTQKELVTDEAEKALIEVGLSDPYDMTPVVEKKLKKNIDKFAGSIDMETNTKLVDNFKTILSEGLSIDEGTSLLQSTFTELTESRAEKIVRTETIRASNFGTEEGRKQSGVVVKKEWYTAVDERVCPYCNSMNGTIVGLDTSYIDNGETMDGGDEGSMKIDYGNVDYPPLHCNCRCTILPVIGE